MLFRQSRSSQCALDNNNEMTVEREMTLKNYLKHAVLFRDKCPSSKSKQSVAEWKKWQNAPSNRNENEFLSTTIFK